MSDDLDREAMRIFAEAREKERAANDPGAFNAPRREAAAALINAVISASEATGWTALSRDPDDSLRTRVLITADPSADFGVLLIGNAKGIEAARVPLRGGQNERFEPALLRFDIAQKEWVSDEIDPRIVPEPGKPYAKRTAAAVVAELVVKVLTTA